jgi:hypothetical protein
MAYFHFEGKNGNVRIKLKDIKDFRPTPPDLISINAEPIGTTIILKNGTEIDVNMDIEHLRKHIRGW